MEDNHLARFSHTYSGGVEGYTTAAPFTTDDKELQLDRFHYTMNSVLSHFETCRNTARVLRFDDENENTSEVLMEAVREDLLTVSEIKKLKTKQALKDKTLTFTVMAALNISIYRKKVKVITVVDRREKLSIPESLRCVTYIPFDTDDNYLEDLHIIVSGVDIPMKTELMLSAGDVAYGLAWNYVTNYLMKVLPGKEYHNHVLNGIDEALQEKGISNGICPHKLYIVIPKSCGAGGVLKDKREDTQRIIDFAKKLQLYFPLEEEGHFPAIFTRFHRILQ
ncbi:unnamed protein product [Mytilus edulis]|uniref:STING ligand-binding domain-containing protein n=1 Tax=Mytilus edulis TaxID=6550 RepID=A0A8S3SNC5_MYTED|nr:unnamed protein product [Mytilus edulis]